MQLVIYAPFIFTSVFSKSAKLPLPAPENPVTGQIRFPILECFKDFDTDGNARISFDELWQGLTDGLGHDIFGPDTLAVNQNTFSKETVDEAFEKNDLSKDGQLSINEFVNVMIWFLKESKNEEQLKFDYDDYPAGIDTESIPDRSFFEYRTRMAFESADVDGNGILTELEMMMFITKMPILYMFGSDDMKTFVLDMIRLNDADGDGLDIDEFLNFMVKTVGILVRNLGAADDGSLFIGLGFGEFYELSEGPWTGPWVNSEVDSLTNLRNNVVEGLQTASNTAESVVVNISQKVIDSILLLNSIFKFNF